MIATIERFNGFAETGIDEDFGRAVSVKDIGASYVEFEVGFQVASVGDAGLAQDDLYDRLSRGFAAAGLHFASRDLAMGGMRRAPLVESDHCLRLLQMTPLFASLNGGELRSIASQMQRLVYESDAVILEPQQSFQSIVLIQAGVASYSTGSDASGWIEIGRLGPGDYFGEFALLTGHATGGRLVALNRLTTYRIGKDVVQPLLQTRPTMAEDFSLILAQRQKTLARGAGCSCERTRHVAALQSDPTNVLLARLTCCQRS